MNKTSLILLILLATLFGVAFTLFFTNDLVSEASTYTDFGSAAKMGKKVHVVGRWTRRDDYHYDSEKDLLEFWMSDTTQNEVKVLFHDPMPANFESAEKIVVVGKMHEGYFDADAIQMKCPSKYENDKIEAPGKGGNE